MEGNQQKMREALEEAREALIFYSGLRLPAHLNDVKVHDVLADIETARSATPRNCDRFADEIDAQIAFLNEVWLISVDREIMLDLDKYENWTDEMRKRYGRWLLAPAVERKEEENEND